MPTLEFNVIPVGGFPYSIFWNGSRNTAYVVVRVSATDPDLPFFQFQSIDFTTGAPVVGSLVSDAPLSLSPPSFGHTNGTPLSDSDVFTSTGANTAGSCIDQSGRLWLFLQNSLDGSPPDVLWFVGYDPVSGSPTASITSYNGGAPLDSYTCNGIYSFMAGGVNYIWAWVNHAVHATGNTPHDEILIFNPALPSYSTVSAEVDATVFYTLPAPIFDNVEFAYVIVSSDLVGEPSGSFILQKYSVLGGSASLVGSFGFGGTPTCGIYDNLHNRVLLYTSQGGLLAFDVNTESWSIAAVAGTFASVDAVFPNAHDPASIHSYYPGEGVETVGFVNPLFFAYSQVGQADFGNCTLLGMGADIVAGDHGAGTVWFGAVKRLNLDNYSLLDEHAPPQEWLSANPNPAAMTTSGFIHVSALNSLLWMSGYPGTQVYQLKWPSQGTCAGGGGGGGGGSTSPCPSAVVPIGNPYDTICS